MKTLPFGNVKITDTKFCKDIKNNDEFMDSLDMDKLLFAYYTNTDICPKASSPYGGWENINFDDEGYSHISGHTLGHMLSAMSQRLASEGKFGDKIDYAVDELAKCQSENGYINTKPEKVIEDLEEDRTGTNHYYSMHKHLAGCSTHTVMREAKRRSVFYCVTQTGSIRELKIFRMKSGKRCLKKNTAG